MKDRLSAMPTSVRGRSPSSMARWTRRLATTAAIAAMSIVGTLIWQAARPLRPVPLTTGLGGKWAEVSAEMDERVKAMFPIGSPVEAMGEELEREGFRRMDWGSSPDGEHRAMRREDRLPCNIGAYVHWRDDGTGRVAAVRGVYQEEGCL